MILQALEYENGKASYVYIFFTILCNCILMLFLLGVVCVISEIPTFLQKKKKKKEFCNKGSA
jgi:hypothetical protein